MIELTFLALMNRLMNWGRAPVIASRTIAADAARLLTLISDPAVQRQIVEGASRPLRLRAYVEPRRSKKLVSVRVQRGKRDLLWLTWILTPRRGTTEVDLAAQVESRSVAIRLVLLLGGRRWLRERLERTLGTLGTLAHCAAEDLGAHRSTAELPPRPHTDSGVDASLTRARRRRRPAANAASSSPRVHG